MISAIELRIGNYLEYFIGEDGCAWDSTKLDGTDIVWAEKKPDNFNKVHRPIKLTPEILEKCGFVKFPYDSDEEYIEYYELEFEGGQISYYKNGEYYVSGTYSPDFYGAKANIQYLHQLQNLYFALTGEELPINL